MMSIDEVNKWGIIWGRWGGFWGRWGCFWGRWGRNVPNIRNEDEEDEEKPGTIE